MNAIAPPSADSLTDALHANQVIVMAMASLAEMRESDTESHILRVQGYVQALTKHLRTLPALEAQLTDAFCDTLRRSVPTYDLGSIAIPDRILLKPGRLSASEVAIMRTHTTLGHAAILRAEKTLGKSTPLLDIAKELTLSHQEKWDGSGYPQGIFGDQIPLSARIVALADVYDALITSKVYKDGISHEKAVEVIRSQRGAHFDPAIVDVFLQIHAEFAAIAAHHADTDADMQQKIEYLANAIAEVAEM
jgi:putative two-component system response regulator